MSVVFIPTRRRLHCLDKALPKWQEQDVEIFLVVEKEELSDHEELSRGYDKIKGILRLPQSNMGITYARNWILDLADEWGLKHLIMSDDDLYPRPTDDVNRLCEIGDLPTIGMGAMLSFYGLLFGNETLKTRDDPLLCIGSMGKRLFSLDVQRAIKVGGYDSRLHSSNGDNEIIRDAIKYGYTWYVHAGVNATSIAGRFTPGGINSLHGENEVRREMAAYECHKMIYEKWGDRYVSKPKGGKRIVTKWTKLLDDYCPNWESRKNW